MTLARCVSLWRVAADTPLWTADDMADKGAAHKGGRWNHAGEHVCYAATSIWLAALSRGRTALLAVPSVIVNEEDNMLVNPAHADAKRITATKPRRFLYDPRV